MNSTTSTVSTSEVPLLPSSCSFLCSLLPVLAVFAALYIVPALYYYFRVVVHAWLRKPGEQMPVPQMSSAQAVALGVAVFVSLAAGLYPEPFARLARYAFGQ